MGNLNESTNEPKQRHGCVTAWLLMIIISNSLTAFIYLFGGNAFVKTLNGGVSTPMLILLTTFGIANVLFAVMLFRWRKWGFWGFLITSICTLGINLNIGLSVVQSILGLFGVVVLYGVLQIKEEDKTAWGNLE